ncbi:hypothetical protein ADL15_07765 [Actinoplanes awajinensis subsp. mycoplanecinus]|uniref:2-isopropylmalate synthase n=2 Tax=Actinoplanes awajinensis TaxID=135946 RepID=A0A0X3V7D8_9ACTN|nr:hypothetical protein ADL15_07765 [Actinoplanes awajinensis subsp. mycoplanecinus]
MFELLVELGFKEIEIGFPCSSATDWAFVRDLIERDAIPSDVLVQVMSPMRTDLIEQTATCLKGLSRGVLQVFNPTSAVQRRDVFEADRQRIKDLAVAGAETALRMRDVLGGTKLSLQYAPESFSQTEPDFALEVCNAVLELWQPSADDDIRVNLPATVEAYPPMEFGDRIEWMHRHLAYRDRITLSVHPHNDRGTGVAAAEMAVLAGAQRVEGTLFGNGERSGNVCLVTLAMNLFSQGVVPGLDFGDLDRARRVAEACTGMTVPPRHPWAGDLVYTSFAGSHQDAISKSLRKREQRSSQWWDVPYLPIDPHDIGREYSALIRVNNQSGKGGVNYLMRTGFGLDLPRRLQIDLSKLVQAYLDEHGGEVSRDLLWTIFQDAYCTSGSPTSAPMAAGDDPDVLLAALAQATGSRFPYECLELTVQDMASGSSCCFAHVAVAEHAAWGFATAQTRSLAVWLALAAAVEKAGSTNIATSSP